METPNGVDRSYSFTASPEIPTTNILVPSLENATPCGEVSCDATGKKSTKDAVETSNGVDRVYSFTSCPATPTTNILVPLLENATPCWTFFL